MTPEQEAAGYRQFDWVIPSFRGSEVSEKVKALSRKAQELGLPGFGLKFGERRIERVQVNDSWHRMEMVPVTLIGGQAKLPGWNFVAKIDHGDHASDGNLVQSYSQELLNASGRPDLLSWLSECEPNCEHCEIKRDRTTTFIFSKDQDPTHLIQIGSSCVKDFSGHRDPAALILAAGQFRELIDELEDPEWLMPSGAEKSFSVFPVSHVLQITSAIVREDGGWIPKNDTLGYPNPSATTVKVHNIVSSESSEISIKPEDEIRAQQILKWLTHEHFDHRNEVYRSNLQQVAKRGYVPRKGVGLAASGVIAFEREIERIQHNGNEQEQPVSVHVGSEGERIERAAKLEKKIPIDGDFGTSILHIFRDVETGAKMTWFNSGAGKFEEGETYTITGRIKKHQTRNDLKETQLSRVNCPDLKLHNTMGPQLNEKDFLKKLRKLKNPDALNNRRETLLYQVSEAKSHYGVGDSIIRELLDRGADPTVRSSQSGNTPFDIWVIANDAELIEMALQKYPELTTRWTDADLEDYEVDREPWVPKFREIREAALADRANKEIDSRTRAIDALLTDAPSTTSQQSNALVSLEDDDEADEAQLRIA